MEDKNIFDLRLQIDGSHRKGAIANQKSQIENTEYS